MVFDPYAPPPEQPAYPPYPAQAPYPGSALYQGYPPQYGWQPYPYAPPARRGLSRPAIVAIVVGAVGLVALIPVLLYAAGGIVSSSFEESGMTFGGGSVEVSGDERGPAFALDLPPGWEFVPTVPDPRYRTHLETHDARVAIGSAYVPREEPLDVTLAAALRAIGEGAGVDGTPHPGSVAGHPAVTARLVDDDPGTDVWVVAFHGKSALWYARYTGPHRDDPSVPTGLTDVLKGWQW